MNIKEIVRGKNGRITSTGAQVSAVNGTNTAIFIVQEAARRVGVISPDTIENVYKTEKKPDEYDSDATIFISGLNQTVTDVMGKEGLISNYEPLEIWFKDAPTDVAYDEIDLPEDFGGFVSSGVIVMYYPQDKPLKDFDLEYIKLIELKESDSDTFVKSFINVLFNIKDLSKENLNYVNRYKIRHNSQLIYTYNIPDYTKYVKVVAIGIYKSLHGVNSPSLGKRKKYFDTDGDWTDIDVELLVRGTALYYAQTMGMESRLHQQRYEEYIANMIKNQANKNRIVDSSMTYHALGRGKYG
ncbi:MAG: hypothetical protein LBU10_01205 [Endomicrobium sp.]|jgi:hypothetical protein|nr:hypothetical protein [Endomicrobium sp.]